MAVGTLARAERASWTGAGGPVCQTRLPCALNIVFIAASLLVCLVGDQDIVSLSSAALVVWRGRKTPSESDRNRLTPTAAPCTIRGPPYSPTGHIIPSTSISNDHPRPDIRLRAQLNCSTTCLVPVGPEAIPLGPNSVWRAVWGDSKRTPQWSDTARILQILLFVSSASDPQARAPAPSGVLRRAALPSGDIVG